MINNKFKSELKLPVIDNPYNAYDSFICKSTKYSPNNLNKGITFARAKRNIDFTKVRRDHSIMNGMLVSTIKY